MKIINRKFNREYQELEKYEAGIVLTGAEAKSVKTGRITLEGSYVKILGSEAYLVNAQIPLYQYARSASYDPRRTRKILLHKSELVRLKTKLASASGLTVAPVSCYNRRSLIKLEIALVKARRDIEKRKLEKARDVKRAIDREIKDYLKR
jgi:SsrA-binding protein